MNLLQASHQGFCICLTPLEGSPDWVKQSIEFRTRTNLNQVFSERSYIFVVSLGNAKEINLQAAILSLPSLFKIIPEGLFSF